MSRRRIAIACQGGGSQCAFVAGALKTFFENDVQRRFSIVGLSGTSGGAITAAVAWLGLLRQAQGDTTPVQDRILACWKDLTAQTPQEIFLDGFCVQTLRLVERGLLPSLANSPSSLRFRLWAQVTAAAVGRPEFTDLRALLLKHLTLADLPSLIDADSPVLLVGAGDVLEGSFKIFSSMRSEISVESLLASAAIPNLFPAVWVDGHAYWDGIFASNPPVTAFLRETLMGEHLRPEEIWIIQVNRPQHDTVPESPSDIFDVRNQLAGNLSLGHELQLLEIVNLLIAEGGLTETFRTRFRLNVTQPIKVRFIRMSEALRKGLDYPSKLSRQPQHIARLIADGEGQARRFLADLTEEERVSHPAGPQAELQLH